MAPLPDPPAPLPVTAPSEFMLADGQPMPGADQLDAPLPIPPPVFRPEAFDQRVLALALAANDLRDAMWVARQCDLGRPKVPRLDGYDGEVMGRALWAVRVAAGTMHETLDAIRVLKRECESDPMWTRANARLNVPEDRAWWDAVLALSQEEYSTRGQAPANPGPGYDDREYLGKVRNKLAYHYLAPQNLWDGYDSAFLNRATPQQATDWAWFSLGERLSQQRFFFADAAIQFAHQDLSGDPQKPYKKLNDLVELVARGVNVFIAVEGAPFLYSNPRWPVEILPRE